MNGVLFDLDGVLVDSTALHVRAYEYVFSDAGLSFSEAAKKAVGEGKPRSHVIDLALPPGPAELKRRLADAKPRALKRILDESGDCALPGAKETVGALAKAGVPVAVVTNSGSPWMWLERLGVASQVRVVVTGDDVSSPKPSPDGYLLGAARLGVEPHHCLAIEDSRDGWLAAKSAGMQVAILAREQPKWLDAETARIDRLDATDILRRIGR